MNLDPKQFLPGYIIGTIIVLATMCVWYLAETHGVGTGALLAFVVPVIGALFVGSGLSNIAANANRAANQTNGTMDQRIEAAVTRALASRDQARTWQATSSNPDQPPLPTDNN